MELTLASMLHAIAFFLEHDDLPGMEEYYRNLTLEQRNDLAAYGDHITQMCDMVEMGVI